MRDLLAPACFAIEVVHVAQWAKLDDMDSLLSKPCVEVFLLEIRVNFHLMDCWYLQLKSQELYFFGRLVSTIILLTT